MGYYLHRFLRGFDGEVLAVPGRVIGLAFLIFLFVIGAVGISPHLKNILVLASIFALFAASWDLLFFSGQLNLGHGAFFGASAYTSAILSSKFGLAVWLTVPMGALAGVIIGLVVAIPSLRLRGPYLAIVTLAVPVILQGVVYLFPDITGGELGLFSLPAISDSTTFVYYFCLIVMLVCVAIMWKATDTRSRMIRSGIVFCALREDEISARTSRHQYGEIQGACLRPERFFCRHSWRPLCPHHEGGRSFDPGIPVFHLPLDLDGIRWVLDDIRTGHRHLSPLFSLYAAPGCRS